MKKNLIILLLTAALVLAIWRPDIHRLIGTKTGELDLPLPTDDMSTAGLSAMLIGISIVPPDAPRLATKDRMPFLSYVQQICALAEIPAKKPFYLSANADVWRILRVNFTESEPWFDDPAIVYDEPGNPPVKMVNVKAIAPKVLRLVP